MKWEFTGRYQEYNWKSLRTDLLSGTIVGIIAIPLGMAFAIASGVKPEYGIYTTIVAGILISLFGGSKFQIGGPTGAFIPILLGIVMQFGYENLLIAGFMAGVFLLLMGVLKLGALMKYIPRPVTIGFTSGIAVIIFSGQIANFLGLDGLPKHEQFILNMKEVTLHLAFVNPYSVITAVISLTFILLIPQFAPKIPGPLVALVVSSFIVFLFFDGKVATIGSTFGDIPDSLPALHLPQLSWQRMEDLVRPALAIAVLGGIESLLSAVVADGMTGSRHNSNRELIGQGIANMVAPLFGGIPATGAIARTATNIKNGAVSPISGVIHAVTVLLILLIFAPYASRIPLAAMAPILMVVAWNMSERNEFMHVLRTRTNDSVVLLLTFLLTVFTNLTFAVEAGMILAVILFVKRMSGILRVTKVLPDPSNKHEKMADHMVYEGHDCPQISIFTIEGPLFFGAADYFANSISNTIRYKPKILLLRMSRVPFLDTTGESNLQSLVRHFLQKDGGLVLISGMKPGPREVLKRAGLYDMIGEGHFFEHTGDAVNYALSKLDTERCVGCKHNAFKECAILSKPLGGRKIV